MRLFKIPTNMYASIIYEMLAVIFNWDKNNF